ncbi:MAG TPA: hypothetical protein VGC95_10095, partial [Chitinophagaceae bacterium]
MRFKPLRLFGICAGFVLFISATALSQQPVFNYDTQWKHVHENIDNGLPRTALKVVQQIIAHAKKDHRQPDLVKSLYYQASLAQQLTDGDASTALLQFTQQVQSVDVPGKSIMKSLVADLYGSYYREHRWEILGRSNTSSAGNDPAT